MSPLFNTNIPEAGSYTPEFEAVTNVSGFTIYEANWEKIDDSVTVTGKVGVDPILITVNTEFRCDLPFDSDFSDTIDCNGNFSASNLPSISGGISADIANNKANFKYTNTTQLGETEFYYSFTYKII